MIAPDELREWLKSGPRLGDGAMGTMLQRAGLPPAAAPEGWNRERPDAVRAVHEAYRDAGAEWLQTNSFGGNRLRLEMVGLGSQVTEVNTAAARLAGAVARPAGLLVAGTVGPTGARSLPPGEARELFAEQVTALVGAGVDLLLIETMVDLEEALAALQAARSRTAMPVVVTLTCPDGRRTPTGDEPEAAARRLAEAGADAVGVNCGGGPAELIPLLRRMRTACPELPLVAQPSAGLPQWVESEAVYPIEPAAMAAWAPRLVDAGADLVGGCCGTTPEHVQAMREALLGRRIHHRGTESQRSDNSNRNAPDA